MVNHKHIGRISQHGSEIVQKGLNDLVNLFETSKGLADCHLIIVITHMCQFGTEDLRKYFIKYNFYYR